MNPAPRPLLTRRFLRQVKCLCANCVQGAPYKAELRDKHKGEFQRMMARRFRKAEP